jgi:hypothetical protein
MIFPNSCLLTVTTECVTVLNDGDGVRIELLHCEARTTLINFGDIAREFYPFKNQPAEGNHGPLNSRMARIGSKP